MWLFFVVVLSCFSIAVSSAIMPDVRVLEILKTARILDDGIGFDGTVAMADQEWTEFCKWFAEVPGPLDRINQLTEDPDLRAAAIYISAEAQDDGAFYSLSLRVFHRFSEGTASEIELDAVLAPGYAKRGLLASKYREPELRGPLEKCHAKVTANDRLTKLIEHILSGQGAKDIVASDEGSFPGRYRSIAEQSLREDESARGQKRRGISPGESTSSGRAGANITKGVLLVGVTLAVLAGAFWGWCRFKGHGKGGPA
jgi:hypothetical protein